MYKKNKFTYCHKHRQKSTPSPKKRTFNEYYDIIKEKPLGYNRSETQRCKCKDCGIRYTLEPKQHEYPEETKELVYYSGVRCQKADKPTQA